MAHDLTGLMIGHYQIISPIEQGGMATVYLASDIHLQRQVAIKVFQFAKDQGRTHEFFLRFIREAQVVARLDHPNIVLVHDYGEQDSLAYLVMPYFAHGSLKNVLQTRGRLSIEEALHFCYQLLDALQYAHERGLIHRDIKPGNILFKDKQTAVLADFGLVKETVAGNTEEVAVIGAQNTHQPLLTNGAMMGTPYYMAPEQIQGHVQSQSDIYSLGLVLYEMLTGRLPFTKSPTDKLIHVLLKQTNEEPLSITELDPTISPQLGAAIMRSLEKGTTQRYQRPQEFAEALRRATKSNSYSLSTGSGSWSGGTSEDYITIDLDLDATMPRQVSKDMQSSLSMRDTPHLPEHASGVVNSLRSAKNQHKWRRWYLFYGILAAVLVLALILTNVYLLSPTYSTTKSSLGHKVSAAIAPPTPKPAVTVQMPQTQTDCPATGAARAAVTASYASLGENVVVYAASTSAGNSMLMSYNPQTLQTKTIVTIHHEVLDEQLSSDGQWVIFATYDIGAVSGTSLIQMVRIDGQGLQTLYCSANTPTSMLVSPGLNVLQGWNLSFSTLSPTDTHPTLFVLNLLKGTLIQQPITYSFRLLTWDGDERLDLLKYDTTNPTSNSSVMQFQLHPDFTPPTPTISSMIEIPALCSDLSFSLNYNAIYSSHCNGQGWNLGAGTDGDDGGPSTLTSSQSNDTTGKWSQAPLYTSNTLAIARVRAVTSTKLLLVVSNTDAYQSQMGLWVIDTDGKHLKRLYSDTSAVTMLNSYSQYPWSNVSADGNTYAVKSGSTQSPGYDKLLIGALDGGQTTVIAADGVHGIDENAMLNVVGWTTV